MARWHWVVEIRTLETRINVVAWFGRPQPLQNG